ncbi:hypothetical protein TWF481_001980 [Arthrobotrys musiformis]|uniref:F-box domain-containing protein n=1 Tax=Arthrobotrys musiformis TaxID=47236 RepID=A0AAV9VXA1_9PEZI
MGLKKRTKVLAFRGRSLLRAILPLDNSKTPPSNPHSNKELVLLPSSEPKLKIKINIQVIDEKKYLSSSSSSPSSTKTATIPETVEEVERVEEKSQSQISEILLLPAEILRDIFSYLNNCDLQSLYHTHTRFRGIVLEHRSFFCRELASRNLRYFARYLKPAFFDLQRESRLRFLDKTENDVVDVSSAKDVREHPGPGQANIPAWYLKLHKLDKITRELYSLMPPDENEWELEYLRIQGLPPSQYNPRVWPRPGNPFFYFTHTIISFYQYNSLVKLPKDSLVEFKERDLKPVCRCAQGYFRSTAHLGILCAVYMACLKFKTEESNRAAEAENKKRSEDKESKEGEEEEDCDLSLFLPELGGGLGNYIKGTRVSVKELFKMVVVVMYPGNLLKVIKSPTRQTMARLKIVLETLKDVLVRNEEERRKSGVDRMYTKGLEMMEGFAQYWEDTTPTATTDHGPENSKLQMLRYFDDWDLL